MTHCLHVYPSRNSFFKQHARAGSVCLLGGVNHAQHRMSKPLGIGDCCNHGPVGDVMHFMLRLRSVYQRNFCLDYSIASRPFYSSALQRVVKKLCDIIITPISKSLNGKLLNLHPVA